MRMRMYLIVNPATFKRQEKSTNFGVMISDKYLLVFFIKDQ